MTTVQQAEKFVLAQTQDYGTETVPFELALGRVLAVDLKADRDLPPFNRATMDGIAINHQAVEEGMNNFHIKATQAAGDEPISIEDKGLCIEIMTGAALHASVDTVIPYECLEIRNGQATITVDTVKKGQNVHLKGRDKQEGDVVAAAGQKVTPAIISLAASVGAAHLQAKKLPRVMIISSGDELVDVADTPTPYQIRRSNNYTVKAVLTKHAIHADILHIPDDPAITRKQLAHSIQNYDVILLSGGVSMGKFDYVPKALDELQVEKLFHKVSQRPGKPFWFGRHQSGVLVFAFPGNPVATFMCLHRYFLLWLNATLGLLPTPPVYAALARDFNFTPPLQYFLQVTLNFNQNAQLIATPVEGNGSGDFANLADTDAFIELPLEHSEFKTGEIFRVWKF
ncbi:molybdopterin molybdotransferase MoeA [Mucilaginibacter psychrotolerans]|uniref:Molybdopterin molybdenumtransferase n=1 Tax=Mucilaginibacter psychrotolerans TaxID=1524096 RepID=A0A4Y8SMA8_9SPHI|nr:molybdopterin molybdotransferase MoeA [Mucilaginibacter psychrotolerans]TFF39594.1 molybdopterin molybdotransferase MoeA [Mucilaginibacter psychrotolerans]